MAKKPSQVDVAGPLPSRPRRELPQEQISSPPSSRPPPTEASPLLTPRPRRRDGSAASATAAGGSKRGSAFASAAAGGGGGGGGPPGDRQDGGGPKRRATSGRGLWFMAAGAAAVAACAVLLAPLLRGRRGPFLPRHALQLDGSSAAGAPAAASAGSMMNRRRPGEDEKRANPSAFPPGSQQAPPPPPPPRYFSFPPGFVWGAATSSYQIEGAASEGGRTPSVWDDFCALRPSPILDGSSGDVACDHYHRAEEDADLIQSLGFTAYRFSVSWSRVLRPDGSINPPGVGFYSRLIDALLRRGIEPWVTMHHWDLPSHLEGGWLNRSTVDAFERYADVLLQQYGDRVERWITVNEPWTVSAVGYGSGEHAPGHASASEPYLAGHHLLLAHAGAVRAFRRRYGGAGGRGSRKIGIANSGDYRYPRDPESQADREAAERAMLFQWGWFVHPLVHGDYPPAMREILGPRLPEFTAEERELVLGSYDFLGLNYYSSLLASDPGGHPGYEGYWADMRAGLTSDPGRWEQNDMGWNVAPDGLRDMLRWIAASYGSPEIYVTENGSAEPEPDLEAARRDTKRAEYFERHLAACAEALLGSGGGGGQPAAVDLRGYFAWSLLDNFEWQFGYTRRFGIAFVDFDPASPTYLDRTPKGSARFLAETIRAGGTNLGVRLAPSREEEEAEAHRKSPNRRQRTLPESVIVGYGSNVQAVKRAVREGVNVVIWSFVDFRSDADGSAPAAPSLAGGREPEDAARREQQEEAPPSAALVTNLDLAEVRRAIRELDEDGFQRTVHLMSVGGWNGRHLDPKLSALDWYGAYRHYVGDLFHGIDWDLEGNDDLGSPYNVFTLDCLDKMADISRLAKTDGYVLGMAPPQSYLDAFGGGSRRFSRLVNLTDTTRTWHSEFSYFGANAYAYLLQRAGDWIDLVFLQFYESYSRAHMTILSEGITPAAYLERFIEGSLDNGVLVGVVDFSDDPNVKTPSRSIRVPLSKLVIGLANGWADNGDDKTLFVSTREFDDAWTALRAKGIEPRGAGFWTIDEEGTRGAYFARELNRTILHASNEIS